MSLDRQERIRQLLEKYRQQACSEEEIQQLYQWLEEEAAAGEGWKFAGDEEKTQLKNSLRQAVFSSIEKPAKRHWLRYAAVAAGFLLCVGIIRHFISVPGEIAVASEPGKTRKLNLPDGTTVWLNDNTELAYRSNFENNRTLELRKGEAFFLVKKDAAHPFIVKSDHVNTAVLGTSFSVKLIRSTGDVKVSVVTGKVAVSRQEDTLGYLLPGQRLRYFNQKGAAVKDSVLTGEADGWIHGDLFLQDASLAEVIQWLQDHFNVKVNNQQHKSAGQYYLQAKSDISLPEILKILNLLGEKNQVQFSLHDHTVMIQ